MRFKLSNIFPSIIASILILVVSPGCKKFVQIPSAPNIITSSQVFADSADASAAVAAMYVTIMGASSALSAYDGTITVFTGLSSDELVSNTGVSDQQAMYMNDVISTNLTLYTLWATPSYPAIYKANSIIQGVTASTGISSGTKNQFVGEAEFVRAFCYFQLVNLYGGVPVALTTNFQTNAILANAPVDSVYQQIITDLIDAQKLLPTTYLTPGRVRPNQYTASALLAKVYLYQRQWANAEAAATQIINSGIYSLSPLNSVFLSTIVTPANQEPIWQLMPVQPGYETSEGQVFLPTSSTSIPKYTISPYLLNAFEPGDLRKGNPSYADSTFWINEITIEGATYYYPYKYKLNKNSYVSTPNECYNVFRLGEQYLIRAEARAEQNNITGATGALADLNIIRNRAGLANYAGATDQASVLAAIYHERQVELFCEWGNRWFDLKRTGLVDSVMGSPGGVCAAKGGTWNTEWQVYPIPIYEMQADPFLMQNPGY